MTENPTQSPSSSDASGVSPSEGDGSQVRPSMGPSPSEGPMEGGFPPRHSGVSFQALFKPFSVWRLLVGLFLYPRLAILNARVYRLWGKMLGIVVVLSIGHAFLKTRAASGEIERQCASLMSLCVSSFSSLTCTVGDRDAASPVFSWGNAGLTTPFHAEDADWRVDAVERLADFDPSAVVSEVVKGLVIGHDGLLLWLRGAPDMRPFVHTLPSRNLAKLFQQYGNPRENAYELDSKVLMELAVVFRYAIQVCAGILYALESLQMILVCVVIFILITYMFNRREHKTFGSVIASAFACVTPPFLLSAVCDLIPACPMDLNSKFTLFFVIYLLIIFFDRSVVIQAPEER